MYAGGVKMHAKHCKSKGSKSAQRAKSDTKSVKRCEPAKGKTTTMGIVKTDLYHALFPVYHLSVVWGLLPVRFVKHKPDRYIGQVKLPLIIYSICLLAFLISAQVWGLWRDLRDGWAKSTRMKSPTAVIVTCTDIMAVAILASVAVLGAPLRWKQLQNIMDRLVEVDEQVGIVTPTKHRRYSIILVSTSLIILCIATGMDIYTWNFQVMLFKKKNDKGPLNYAPVYILYAIVLMIECQYSITAYNLGERFVRLNKCLENISKSDKIADLFNKDHGLGDFREHGQFGAHIRPDAKAARLFKKTKIYDSPMVENSGTRAAERISRLVAVHSSLADTVLLVNSAFGVPVLIAVLTCLLHLIVTPYFLIMEASGNGDGYFLTAQCLWCVIHVGRLLVVVQPCYKTSTEAKTTAVLVSQLLSHNWEPEVKKQLDVFSLQLLHRPLEFSACGLCTLDRTLVTSIAGAVTTYLVILIQFQTADESKSERNLLKNFTQILKYVSYNSSVQHL